MRPSLGSTVLSPLPLAPLAVLLGALLNPVLGLSQAAEDARAARKASQAASLATCRTSGCSGAEFPEVEGESTPQAVLAELQSAALTGDAYRIVSLIPPSSRCQYLYQTLDLVGQMSPAPKGVRELGNKYGYPDLIKVLLSLSPDSERSPQQIFEDFRTDVTAKGCSSFLADLVHVMAKYLHEEEFSAHLLGTLPVGTVETIQPTDDEDAMEAHAEGVTVRLQRENGRWFAITELFG